MIKVIKRMLDHLRGSKHQIEDKGINLRSKIRSMCGVGLVEEIIAGDIVHNIKLVGLIYIVHNTHKLLWMLLRGFLVFMQHWVTNRQTIKHLSLRWMVRFVIKLFLF